MSYRTHPTHHEIAMLAHELWVSLGRLNCSQEVTDGIWCWAERLLMGREP
jgi:hypothetical protein